jgi:WD40 repeat protein
MSANRMKPLKDDEIKGYIRKVDLKSELAIATANNDKAWFIAGNDFYLKKYTLFPTEQYQNITWVSPPSAPTYQLESHDLETTCFHFSKEHDVLMTGGKDGKVLVRNVQDLMHKSNHTEITGEV